MRHSRIIYQGLPYNGVRRFPDINHIWQSNRLLPILYLRNFLFLGSENDIMSYIRSPTARCPCFVSCCSSKWGPFSCLCPITCPVKLQRTVQKDPGFLPKKRFYIHVSWIFNVQSSINFNYTFNNLVSKIEGLDIIYIKDLWPFRPLLTCSYIEGSGTLYQVKLLNITQ